MKISAQDEYGLRILLRIARSHDEEGLSINQLSEAEGLSVSYVAKLTRALRIGELIGSTRGPKGGYVLQRPPDQINISEVLDALGGALFDDSFCKGHTGGLSMCTNSVDCSVRSLWRVVQVALDRVLERITLADLIGTEGNSRNLLDKIVEANLSVPG